jgi:hypothetical protein
MIDAAKSRNRPKWWLRPAEQFLILPHPVVEQFAQFKAANYDRWLGGMRKLRHSIVSRVGSTRLEDMHKLV